MDTLAALAVTLLITVFFVWRYSRKTALFSPKQPTDIVCPRCGNETESLSALCVHCRSPLAVWAGKSDGAPVNDSGEPRPVVNASLCIGCGACVEVCPEQGTLAVVGGKAILAQPDRCKSHGDCVSACPTSAIVLLTGDAKQTLRVPATNAEFESNIPGVFIIGELGGLGLIKTAINEGCQVAETIRKRLRATAKESSVASCYDVIIVGAGPSGLSAALSFHRYGISYLALEQGEIASTVRNYPRKKFLMEEPVEVPLFGKLMMQDGSKEDLLEVWDRIVNETGVRVSTNQKVEAVEWEGPDQRFTVRTSQGVFQAKYVVLATGKRGSPRKLDAPGEDSSKVAYRLIEAESYSDCDVAVAGGGDSAVEAALALSRVGTNRVTLIHRRSDFSRLRERNRAKLAEADQDGSVKVLRNAQIKEISAESLIIETGKGIMELKNDYLFVLIGGESPDAFLQKVGVDIIERVVAA